MKIKSRFEVVAYNPNKSKRSKPAIFTDVASNRVKRIVEELKSLGYTNLTVSQLDDEVQQLVSNSVRSLRV